MNKIINRIKHKPALVALTIFFILYFISTICLTYSILKISKIEDLLRYLISSLLILFLIFNSFECYKLIFRGKNIGILLYGMLLMILFIVECYVCGIVTGIYSSIDNIYKNTSTYSVNLISMSDSNIKELNDIKSLKIGMLNDDNDNYAHEISKEIIEDNNLDKSNEIIEYETTSEILNDLYKKNINVAFVSSSYVSMFVNTEGYENIKADTKIIYSKSKTIKKLENITIKDENEPFSMLVLGIDSTENDISKVTAFNADSLLLITFNPKTYNATILSIPRDTYVPIACLKNKSESKITHSGWYGESCVVKTVGELMDFDIDYYVKINFAGVVNLVNSLGGIEVDVPYSFCEQNSKREWGSKTVYVKKGVQTINGEQALALSRNRHPNPSKCNSEWTNYTSNDLIRGQNQQTVINAIINKVATNIDLNKLYSILDIIENNVDTNINTNQILSYYNLIKKIAINNSDNIVAFESLYLSTYGKYIYDSLMKLPLSDQIYYNDSLKEIVKEMKINLEIEKPTLIKTFSFSIKNPYKLTTIGKGNYTQGSIETVPNFKNQDKTIAEKWANENNISLKIEYKDVTEGTNGTVLSQSIPYSYIVDNIDKTKGLTITVANVVSGTDTDNSENTNNGDINYPTE